MQDRGGADLLAVVVIIGAAQAVQGAGSRRRGLLLYAAGQMGRRWCGLLLIRQGCGGAVLPFAGGVRVSTLPGSALGVGLELSEL